jgi:hypothetical protein
MGHQESGAENHAIGGGFHIGVVVALYRTPVWISRDGCITRPFLDPARETALFKSTRGSRKPRQRVGRSNTMIIMRTGSFFIKSKPILFTAILGALLAGCAKEELGQVTDPCKEQGSVTPKSLPYFLKTYNGQSNSFTVYTYSSCATPYGNFTYITSDAPNDLVTSGSPSYVRATNGYCDLDANYLRFRRGSTNGAFGPWYIIKPDNGPSPRQCLKLRVKNLTTPPLDYYQGKFVYNNVLNTWQSFNANSGYEWTTVTSFDLCPDGH